jgi:hypothetical protein
VALGVLRDRRNQPPVVGNWKYRPTGPTGLSPVGPNFG